MILISSFASSISESVISQENGWIWRLYVTMFLKKTLPGGGGVYWEEEFKRETFINPF